MAVARSLLLVVLTLLVPAVPTAANVDDTPFRIRADDIALVSGGELGEDGQFDVKLFDPSALIVVAKGDDREVLTTVFEAIARFQAFLRPPCDPIWKTFALGGCAESIEIDLPETPEQLHVVCHMEDGAARLHGRCVVEGTASEGQAQLVLIPGVKGGTISIRISGHLEPTSAPAPNDG